MLNRDLNNWKIPWFHFSLKKLFFLRYLFDWFIHTYLLLQGVEVVYDNTDEQIEDKERTKNDKCYKIDVRDHVAILLWLLVKLK